MSIKYCDRKHSNLVAYEEDEKMLVYARKAVYCFDPKVKYVCENGEEVVLVGRFPTPFFRHQSNTKWHQYIQDLFIKLGSQYNICCEIEKDFGKHRADIYIENKSSEYKMIVEVQHTFNYMETRNAIQERTTFYKQKGYSVIWIIDGIDFNIANVSDDYNDPRYFITEPSGNQKIYSLFKGSGLSVFYLYKKIDDTEYIFQIQLENIKSGLIECDHNKCQDMDDFIKQVLNNNINFTTINHHPTNIENCFLTIKQRGAGTGKTYESVQLLDSDETSRYQTFIYFSKLHSNKTIVMNEIKEQIKRGDLQGKIINNSSTQNQYCIQYENNGKIKSLIIGTIDSFVWANKDKLSCMKRGLAPFVEIAKQLQEDLQAKLKDINRVYISYTGNSIWFNKETCFIIDEAQDLEYEYFKFLLAFMRYTGISCYFVGDKLQSIYHTNNILTNLLTKNKDYFKGINVMFQKDISKNIGRRFENKTIVEGINRFINFEKFGLRDTVYDERHNKNTNKINKEPGFITISLEQKEILKYVMVQYEKIVAEYEYKPSDFLLIFPIINPNMQFVSTFKTKIEEFWCKKYKKRNEGEYSFIHSADKDGRIDLTTSTNKTRIVTGHSSKGDGRNIAFVIGLSEQILAYYTTKPGDIKYESLVYVPITRAKQRLYLIHTGKKGDIYNRMEQMGDMKLNLSHIKSYIPFMDVIQWLEEKTFHNRVTNRIINDIEGKITPLLYTLDYIFYTIRYAMLNCLLVQILTDSKDKNSLFRLCHQVSPLLYYKIKRYNSKEYYEMLKADEEDSERRYRKEEILPLLQTKNNLRIELDDIEETITRINIEYWDKGVNHVYNECTSYKTFNPIKLLDIIIGSNDIVETIKRMVIFTHVFELEKYNTPMTLENVITVINNLISLDKGSKQLELFYKEVIYMKEKFKEIKEREYNSSFNLNYILPYKQDQTENFMIRTHVNISYNKRETVIYLLKPSACDISSYILSAEIELIKLFIASLQEDKEDNGNPPKYYRFRRPILKFYIIYAGGYISFTEETENIPTIYYKTLCTKMKDHYSQFSEELYNYYRQSIDEEKNTIDNDYKSMPKCITEFISGLYNYYLDGEPLINLNDFTKRYTKRIERVVNTFIKVSDNED